MRSFNILNSIDSNLNIVWNKGAYSPIKETRFCGIASNDHFAFIIMWRQ